MRDALLSLEVRGTAAVVWSGWAYDLAKSLAAAAALGLCVLLLTPRGRDRVALLERILAETPALEGVLAVLWTAWVGLLLLLKTAQYLSLQGTGDAAMFLSVVWNAGRGAWLGNPVYGLASHLEDHFEPIVAIYAPLARLTGSPLAVLWAHAALTASAPPLLWLLGRRLGLALLPRVALCLLLAVNPWYQDCLATWFYPAPLAVPVMLAFFAAWEAGRWRVAALAAAALLCVKEEGAPALAAAGAAYVASGRGRRRGLQLMAAAAAGFLAVTAAMGSLGGPELYSKWGLFGWGSSPGEVATYVAAHPLEVAARFVHPPTRLLPPLTMLASTAGLALAFPAGAAAFLLLDAPHRLAQDPTYGFVTLQSHYAAFLLPILFWAAARGARRLWDERAGSRHHLLAGVSAALGAGLLCGSDYVLFGRLPSARLRSGWAALDLVSAQESAWVSQPLSPAAAFRRKLKVFSGFDDRFLTRGGFLPDAVLLDAGTVERLSSTDRARLEAFLREGGYSVRLSEPGVVLLKRPAQPPR